MVNFAQEGDLYYWLWGLLIQTIETEEGPVESKSVYLFLETWICPCRAPDIGVNLAQTS